jgi:hypothetical protein
MRARTAHGNCEGFRWAGPGVGSPNPDERAALRLKGKDPARPAPPDDVTQGYRVR